MNYSKELINSLVPDTGLSIADLEAKFPKRDLGEASKVTRFAPSPTGFLHIGGIFTSLVSERTAHQSGGVFFLRLEDTDEKREEAGAEDLVLEGLKHFGIKYDEGITRGGEIGSYGPYKQSERREIYATCVRHLLEKGLAYPCFCTSEELEASRKIQETEKVRTGYYGKWATCRNLSEETINEKIKNGEGFVIRMRSLGSHENQSEFTDEVKGRVKITENDRDEVVLKRGGLPTYHFAHVVDDHFMRTTDVIRADEWLPSLPTHIELFSHMGFSLPRYAHISPIMKLDEGNKRKLSKRKDPEASVSYYMERGFPVEAVMEYLINIGNSSFEPWKKENSQKSFEEFPFEISKMSKSGALFDMKKLEFVGKEVLARYDTDKFFGLFIEWAEKYNKEVASVFNKDINYSKKIFSIERGGEKSRKDFACFDEVFEMTKYFFSDLFDEEVNSVDISEIFEDKKDLAKTILSENLDQIANISFGKDGWILEMREIASKYGFARDAKSFKENPDNFKGQFGDFAMILRKSLTLRANTPDLFSIIETIGEEETKRRIKKQTSLI